MKCSFLKGAWSSFVLISFYKPSEIIFLFLNAMFLLVVNQRTMYVTQHIEMDQLGLKFKNDFLPFHKWLFLCGTHIEIVDHL